VRTSQFKEAAAIQVAVGYPDTEDGPAAVLLRVAGYVFALDPATALQLAAELADCAAHASAHEPKGRPDA